MQLSRAVCGVFVALVMCVLCVVAVPPDTQPHVALTPSAHPSASTLTPSASAAAAASSALLAVAPFVARTCAVCVVSLRSPSDVDAHVAGAKHRKRTARLATVAAPTCAVAAPAASPAAAAPTPHPLSTPLHSPVAACAPVLTAASPLPSLPTAAAAPVPLSALLPAVAPAPTVLSRSSLLSVRAPLHESLPVNVATAASHPSTPHSPLPCAAVCLESPAVSLLCAPAAAAPPAVGHPFEATFHARCSPSPLSINPLKDWQPSEVVRQQTRMDPCKNHESKQEERELQACEREQTHDVAAVSSTCTTSLPPTPPSAAASAPARTRASVATAAALHLAASNAAAAAPPVPTFCATCAVDTHSISSMRIHVTGRAHATATAAFERGYLLAIRNAVALLRRSFDAAPAPTPLPPSHPRLLVLQSSPEASGLSFHEWLEYELQHSSHAVATRAACFRHLADTARWNRFLAALSNGFASLAEFVADPDREPEDYSDGSDGDAYDDPADEQYGYEDEYE